MAETTTTRFALNLWNAEQDTVNRDEFTRNFKNVENLAAIDKQGLLSARPVYGVPGTYFYATDSKVLYRDSGTSWEVVGGTTRSLVSTADNASSAAATFKGASNQSGDLVRVQANNGSLLSSFTKDGALKSGGVYVTGNGGEISSHRIGGAALSTVPLSTELPAAVTRGLTGQTGNIEEWRTANNEVNTFINNLGEHVSKRPRKIQDSDAVDNNELVTYGQIKRSFPDWKIRELSMSDYNALMVKDDKTIYFITS